MDEVVLKNRNEQLMARTLPAKASLERLDHHVQCIITGGLDVMNDFLMDPEVDVEQRIKAFSAIMRVAHYIEKRKSMEVLDDNKLIMDDEDLVF